MVNEYKNVIAINLNNWLEKSKTGDDEAIKKLYIELKRPIFILALSIVNDYQIAEDIIQETFIKVISNSEGYEMGSNAKAWIMTITRNLSLNYLKKANREEVKGNLIIENCNNFTNEVEGTMEFFRIIENLNQEEKEILALRLVGELSHRQISKMLNISLVSARAKYSRGIKKLRNKMK